MGSIGPTEILVIALIALLLFGAGRIADIGKGLGEGIKNFKKGLKEASRLFVAEQRVERQGRRVAPFVPPALAAKSLACPISCYTCRRHEQCRRTCSHSSHPLRPQQRRSPRRER